MMFYLVVLVLQDHWSSRGAGSLETRLGKSLRVNQSKQACTCVYLPLLNVHFTPTASPCQYATCVLNGNAPGGGMLYPDGEQREESECDCLPCLPPQFIVLGSVCSGASV